MSLRLQMLRAARQARRLRPDLADGALRFLRAAALPSSAFPDRSGKADLYYTVFGLLGLQAAAPVSQGTAGIAPGATGGLPANGLEAASPVEPAAGAAGDPLPPPINYLRTFADGAALDFVHAACLARCWALTADNIPPRHADALPSPDDDIPPPGERPPAPEVRSAILAHIERHRSADGGYNAAACSEAGTAYAAFLALGAYQDLGEAVPDAAALIRSVQSLRTPDGAYANEPAAARGSTPATAAAAMILAELGEEIDSAALEWLLARVHPDGGFLAMPIVPVPDLLSTATALHALAGVGVPVEMLRDKCMRFIEGLLTDGGGFRGHAFDDDADCEYTFYALLALGHLAGE